MPILFKNVGQVVFEGRNYTEEECRYCINQVKQAIIKAAQPSGELVGLFLERTPWIIFSMIAAVELKIPFLPIDIKLPDKRIKFILKNSGIRLVITSEELIDVIGRDAGLTIEGIQNEKIKAAASKCYDNDIAYIIYTSGSTGEPKGVEILYDGLENLIFAMARVIELRKGRRIASFASYSFDMFIAESIVAAYWGLTIILANNEEMNNPRKAARLIIGQKAEIMQVTPSRLQTWSWGNHGLAFLKNMEDILIGGERFPENMTPELKRTTKARLYNMYGPTEATVWATAAELTPSEEITVGKPLLNTEVYIINDKDEVVQGNRGEICIAGKGLAKGYHNMPVLTEQAFILLGGKNKVRAYRTGDIGKIDRDGNLICIGRKDNQIKLNGYRIELEEVDYHAMRIPGIIKAVTCLVIEDDSRFLVLFYMAVKQLEARTLEATMAESLPKYMIPRRFVQVNKFIYTVNDKVDRNAMTVYYKEAISSYKKVKLDVERNLYTMDIKAVEIIEQTLGVPKESLDIREQLKKYHIDSITFMKMILALEEYFEVEFEDEYLAADKFQTIWDICYYLRTNSNKWKSK